MLETGKRVLKQRLDERKRQGTWGRRRTRSTPAASTYTTPTQTPSRSGSGRTESYEWEDEKRHSKEQREGYAPHYAQTRPGPSSRRGSTHDSAKQEEDELMDNLEFFDIGGSPKDLMAYMVKSESELCRLYDEERRKSD